MKKEPEKSLLRQTPRRNPIPFVFILTLLIAAALAYSLFSGSRVAWRYTPLVDAVMEIKYEAMDLLASYHGALHVLLTDVVMPEMDGKELFSQASEKYPDLKVLYMSGYTDDVIVHRGVLEKDTSFIQKPFTVHALATKVREILDNH